MRIIDLHKRTGSAPLPPDPIDPDYQQVLDLATANSISHPSTTQQDADISVIESLKSNSLWDKTDCLLAYRGSAVPDFKKIDLKRKILVTQFDSLNWGVNGVEGAGGYINLNYIPATHGVNYALNNAGIFAVLDKDVDGSPGYAKAIIGAFDGDNSGYVLITNNHTGSGNGNFYCINGLYNEPANTLLGLGGNGFYRTSASSVTVRGANGSKTITANSETPLIDIPLYMLARNTQGTAGLISDERIKYIWIGAALTEAEHATLTSILI